MRLEGCLILVVVMTTEEQISRHEVDPDKRLSVAGIATVLSVESIGLFNCLFNHRIYHYTVLFVVVGTSITGRSDSCQAWSGKESNLYLYPTHQMYGLASMIIQG